MPCLWHSLAGHVQAKNISGTQYSKIKKPKTFTVRAFLCADSKGGCPPTLQGWTACSDQLSCLALSCAACCAAHASIYRKDTAVWQALFAACGAATATRRFPCAGTRPQRHNGQRLPPPSLTGPLWPAGALAASGRFLPFPPGCALRRSCCRWRPRVTCPAAKTKKPGNFPGFHYILVAREGFEPPTLRV